MHLLPFNPEGVAIPNATRVIENAIRHIVCEAQCFLNLLRPSGSSDFLHNILSDYLLPTSYFQSHGWALLFIDKSGSLLQMSAASL